MRARTVQQWVFNDNNWATTKAQTTSSSYWTITKDDNNEETDARNTVSTIPADNGIDKIQGLSFSELTTGSLCLDWTYKHVWMNGSVTVPNLEAGQVVTFVVSDNTTVSVGDSPITHNNNTFTYTVPTGVTGGVTFAVNGYLHSITVTNSEYDWTYTTTTTELDGVNRKTSGTFTFTGAGTINGGTVIDEVPGITMTVGKANDGYTWELVKVSTGNSGTSENLGVTAQKINDKVVIRDNNYVPTAGCFITFKALVNGFLTVNGTIYGGTGGSEGLLFKLNADGTRETHTEITSTTYNSNVVFSKPLLAGETYILYNLAYSIQLHNFTFRPAFLNPALNADQTNTTFSATVGNPAKDGFPKLIDPASETQQNSVKFAGDKTKVYLYKNNDVELLDAGENILIRGTVLDKNGNDGLVAYYRLNSNILKLNPAIEFEDQAYINKTDINNYPNAQNPNGPSNTYAFKNANDRGMSFTSNSPDLQKIAVQKDGGEPYLVTPTFSNYKWEMYVPVTQNNAELEEGATYRITIPAGFLKDDTTTDAYNPEVVRTFTVNKAGELQVKMIYPSGLATVGTTIILETYVNGESISNNEKLVLDDSKKVTGVLSAAEEQDMPISANFSSNQLAFKPTSALKPNTTYTLTISYDESNNVITSKEFGGTIYKLTHTKVFTFKTGSASGTAPTVVSTTPVAGDELNASVRYAQGTISFAFDQDVELEPYSTVNATPINGSEATAHGSTGAPGAATNTLTVGSDGRTVSFDYSADQLKYDLYYEVVIPVNTVVGAGGTPNTEPITLRFKMGKHPNATAVDAATFYPHTWDFCKFGDSTKQGTTAWNIINKCGDPGEGRRVNSLYHNNNSYTTKAQDGYGFDQGNNIYFHGKDNVDDSMDEFQGIRVSLVQSRSNRFEIRKEEGSNADRTDKWSFRMTGNTHYLTLSNVPQGKLYMVMSGKRIGINSPNATFESVDGVVQSENTTVLKIGDGLRKVAIDVATAGDVSFCVYDFTCEKIGVAKDEKTFKPAFAENGKTYATDRIGYDVRYDLLNAFTDHDVKAYYVSSMTDNTADNTGTVTVTEVPTTVAEANQGVMVICQSAVSSETTVPVFKTDVNSPAETGTANLLKVINAGQTALPTVAADHCMYVLSNQGSKSSGISFYRYTGSTFSERAAYLEVPKSWVEPVAGGAARTIRLVFAGDDDSQATQVGSIEAAGVSEHYETDGSLYDLRGQRVVSPSRSGLYIKGGKKVYVKQ